MRLSLVLSLAEEKVHFKETGGFKESRNNGRSLTSKRVGVRGVASVSNINRQ
jgi:hypothetical protein